MNKQNKKIAQQKRAEERKKAEKRAAVIKKLKFWVPVIAVVIVVVVLVWAVATSGNGSSSSDTQSGTESTSTSTSAQDTQSTSESEKTLDKTEGVAAQNGDTVNIDYTDILMVQRLKVEARTEAEPTLSLVQEPILMVLRTE